MFWIPVLLLCLSLSLPLQADPCGPEDCAVDTLNSVLEASTRPDSFVFRSPLQNSGGRVVFPWDKAGDVVPFELTIEVPESSKVKAELWTNANHNAHPSEFEAVPMALVRTEGKRRTYRVDLPIQAIGNYRATARMSTDNGRNWTWAGDLGISDLRFRPHAEEHDALHMTEINVSSVNGGHGTLDDLAGSGSPAQNGKYTLEYLKGQGVNAVWVQPPFKRSVWDQRHPLDDAGSPYATKDYFAVDPDLSARAREILARGGSQQEADAAATQEWKDFVARAHALGIKVVVDIALNHVGHNYEFADLFTRGDPSGKVVREVRRNDFMQIAPDSAQYGLIEDRLSDGKTLPYMEYLAPWLYSSASGNPNGAQSVSDIRSGGGQWHDTKQLNHGGSYGVANAAINDRVVDWYGRILEYWAVDMGADGFRIDHLTGLPQTVLERSFNAAQAAVDVHRPGVHLYLTGEDFFNAEYNASFLDNIQDTWMRNTLMGDSGPGTIRNILSNPYFDDREMLNLSSHDEERFEFHGDMRAAGRMQSLLPLLGGTDMLVAGDELGEKHGMPFKQHNPIGAIKTPSPAGLAITEQLRRAGTAKGALPSLSDDNRTFLDPRVGGFDQDLLALSRTPDSGKSGNPVIVVANMNNQATRENAFNLDQAALSRLESNRSYQVRDWMSDQPSKDLWSEPMTGKQLQEKGLFVKLDPYQVQVLEIRPLP